MKKTRSRSLSLGLTALVFAARLLTSPATAQETPAATFGETVRVEVVNLEVVVTDRKGEPVTGLTADDFQVYEDGELRPIVNFYTEVGGLPRPGGGEQVKPAAGPGAETAATTAGLAPPEQRLHLLVFIDNTHLQATHRKEVFRQLREFLRTRLETSVAVAVVTLGPSLEIHSDFLSDREAVERILAEVEKTSSFNAAENIERRQLLGAVLQGEALGQRGFDQGFATDLEDRIRVYAHSELERGRATLDALSRFVSTLAGIPGRKAMLYVADGIARRPGEELVEFLVSGSTTLSPDIEREILSDDLLAQFQKLAREANASRVTLFTLDAAGSHRTELRSASLGGRLPSSVLETVEANYREPQEFISDATGGRRLAAGSGLEEDLEGMARDLTTFYSLGFTPADGERDQPRRLRVEVRRPGLVVRHRERYQPRNPEREMADATLAALLYGTGSNPLGISLEPGSRQPREEGGSSLLPVAVRIPLDSVALVPDGEMHAGQLAMFVTTQAANGATRPIQKIPFHAAIPADKVEELRGEKLTYTLPLVLRPGDRRIAVGVRDEIGGMTGTVRLDLPGD